MRMRAHMVQWSDREIEEKHGIHHVSSMWRVLRSFFLITLFFSLLILVVYSHREIDVILTSIPLIFSFVPCLPFVSLTFPWT